MSRRRASKALDAGLANHSRCQMRVFVPVDGTAAQTPMGKVQKNMLAGYVRGGGRFMRSRFDVALRTQGTHHAAADILSNTAVTPAFLKPLDTCGSWVPPCAGDDTDDTVFGSPASNRLIANPSATMNMITLAERPSSSARLDIACAARTPSGAVMPRGPASRARHRSSETYRAQMAPAAPVTWGQTALSRASLHTRPSSRRRIEINTAIADEVATA